MVELIPIVFLIAMAWTIVTVTRTISGNRLRQKAIDANTSQELVESLLRQRGARDLDGSLKWGLVVAFIGAALMVLQGLPFSEYDPFSFGLVTAAAGLGLLVHYFIARRQLSAQADFAEY